MCFFELSVFHDIVGFLGCCQNVIQAHKVLSISLSSSFTRSPRAGMHTKRFASMSSYEKRCFFSLLQKHIEFSRNMFENLILWNRLKIAYVLLLVYINQMNYYELNVCLRNFGLGGCGNAWAGAGGTGVLGFIRLVLNILSNNPSR